MDNLHVQHRLIGKEDIDWANRPPAASVPKKYTRHDGIEYPMTPIDATHIPLSLAAYAATGKQTVDEAIIELKTAQTGGGGSGTETGLSGDTTILFLAQDNTTPLTTVPEIQAKIDAARTACSGTLNGYTLTFILQASVPSMAAPLVIDGFHGGKVVMDLNGYTLYGAATTADETPVVLKGVVKIQDCGALVRVGNGTISHAGPNGIYVVRSQNVECLDVAFSSSNANKKAVMLHSGKVVMKSVAGGEDVGYESESGDSVHADGSTAYIDSMFTSYVEENIAPTLAAIAAADIVVSNGYDITGKRGWIEFRSGRLIQWGRVSAENSVTCTATSGSSDNYIRAKAAYHFTPVYFAKKFADLSYSFMFSPVVLYTSNGHGTTAKGGSWSGGQVYAKGVVLASGGGYNADIESALVPTDIDIEADDNRYIDTTLIASCHTRFHKAQSIGDTNNYWFDVMSGEKLGASGTLPDYGLAKFQYDWIAVGAINDSDKTSS